MAGSFLHEGERLDELQRNGYKIIQDPKRFCFGMDAVLLSGFAKVKRGEEVLDLGTGTGIIPILLEAKTEGQHFTGLEIQPESAVWLTITWRTAFPLSQEISKMQQIFLGHLLLML